MRAHRRTLLPVGSLAGSNTELGETRQSNGLQPPQVDMRQRLLPVLQEGPLAIPSLPDSRSPTALTLREPLQLRSSSPVQMDSSHEATGLGSTQAAATTQQPPTTDATASTLSPRPSSASGDAGSAGALDVPELGLPPASPRLMPSTFDASTPEGRKRRATTREI